MTTSALRHRIGLKIALLLLPCLVLVPRSNAEVMLQWFETDWDEMYRRIEEAFAVLQALVNAGEIKGYGVSGNFLSCYYSVSGKPNAYEALCIQRTLGCAVDAYERGRRGRD